MAEANLEANLEEAPEDVKPDVQVPDRKVTEEQVKVKLKEHFNYDSFKSVVQKKSILSILNGESQPNV